MTSGSIMRLEVEIFWEYVPDVRTVRLLNPTFGVLKENPLEKPQVRQVVEDKWVQSGVNAGFLDNIISVVNTLFSVGSTLAPKLSPLM